MAETGSTMEIESQNQGAYHNEGDAPSLDDTSNPTSEKDIEDTHHIVDEGGDSLAPQQNSEVESAEFGSPDSDTGITDSEAGITDSEPVVTDSEAGATDSEVGGTDLEITGPPVPKETEEALSEGTPVDGTPVDLPRKETTDKAPEEVHKEETDKNEEKTDEQTAAKHRRPVIDASKLKDKSNRQLKYRNKQLQLQKKTIDQQKQSKEQKRQAVEERRKKQDEEKKVHRESIVRRSIERSQSAGSREKRRSWDPAKQIPESAPPRGRSMERLTDTPEVVPAGIGGVNKRLSSSVSTLWNPVQLVRLGPNENDWFEVHTPRPKELRSPSPGIDDSNSTYTPRHHSSSPNLALNTSWVRNTLEALIELPLHVQVFESAEYSDQFGGILEEEPTVDSIPQKHRYACSTASSRSRTYATRRRYRAATSQNKSSPGTPIRRTPTGSRGRSTERKTPSPAQAAAKATTPEPAANKSHRPPSPKGFRAPSPKPSTGTPSSSTNSSMHVRQPSLRLKKNTTNVDGKSPADKSKTPVSKSSQPPPIKKALTPAKSSPTRTPRTPSTNKTPAASKTPTTTRTSGARTPTTKTPTTTAKTPTSKATVAKTPTPNKSSTPKPAAAKATPTTLKTTPVAPKAAPDAPKATPDVPKAASDAPKAAPAPQEATTPKEEVPPQVDAPQVAEPDRKSPVSETSSPPPELTAEERAKQALAEKRRQMREKAERDAEIERLRIEQEQKEEEERLQREEEERIREEEEQQRLAEEYRKAEEERLEKAIEDQQRKEEEEKLRLEEEEKKKEEEERIKAEERKKRDEELTEKLKKDEEARDARKKRVDEIMKRARRTTPAVNNDDDERDNRDEDKDIDTQAEKENGIEGNIYNNDNDKYRNYIENGSAVAGHETLSGEEEEGVMVEDGTAYEGRDDSEVAPEGGYLDGSSKEGESEEIKEGESEEIKEGESEEMKEGESEEIKEGESEEIKEDESEEIKEGESEEIKEDESEEDVGADDEFFEKAVTEEVGEKEKDALLMSNQDDMLKVRDDSCEFEDQEEAFVGEVNQPVKFAEIITADKTPVESEPPVFEAVGVESEVPSDNKEAVGDLLGGFQDDSSDGNVFSAPILEGTAEFDPLGEEANEELGGENDGTNVDDLIVQDLYQYDAKRRFNLAVCRQESDATEDDDSTAAQAGDIDTSTGELDISPGEVNPPAGDVDISGDDVRHPCDLDTWSNPDEDERVEMTYDPQGLQDIHEECSEEEEEEERITDKAIEIKNENIEDGDEENDLLQSNSSERFVAIDEKSLQEANSADESAKEEELPHDDDQVLPVVEISDAPVDDTEESSSVDDEEVEAPKDVGTIPEITLDEVEYVHQNSSDDEVGREDVPAVEEHSCDSEDDEGVVDDNLEAAAYEEEMAEEEIEEKEVDGEEVIEDEDNLESSRIIDHSNLDDSDKDEPEDEVKSEEVVEDSNVDDAHVENLETNEADDAIEEESEDEVSPRVDESAISTEPEVDDNDDDDTKPVEVEGDDDDDSHSSSDDSVVELPNAKTSACFEGDQGNVDYRDKVLNQSSEERDDISSSDSENERKEKGEAFHADAGLGYLADEERAQSSSPDISSRSPRVDDAEKLEFDSASETEDSKDIDSFPEVSSLNATRGSPICDIGMSDNQAEEVEGDVDVEESPELDAREEVEGIESGEPSSSLDASGELLDTDSSLADVRPQFDDEETPDEEEQLSYGDDDDESSSDSPPATMSVDHECVEKVDASCPDVEKDENDQVFDPTLPQTLSNQHPSGEDHNGNYSDDDDDVDSVKEVKEYADREENGMGGRQLTSSPSTNSSSSSEGSYTANPAVDYHTNDDLTHVNDLSNTFHQQHPTKHIGVDQDHYPDKALDVVMEVEDDGLNGRSAQADDEEEVSVSTEL